MIWNIPKYAMAGLGIAASRLFFSSATAEPLPFRFGNTTGDLLSPLGNGSSFNVTLPLPKPMQFYDNTIVTSVGQSISGFFAFFRDGEVRGFAMGYFLKTDTRNGGDHQNQVWLRVGNNTDDLDLAREILAGGGVLFQPQVVIIGTWYKVEAFERRSGPQNTFQLVLAYSESGETYMILAYEQLQYYQADGSMDARVQILYGIEGYDFFFVEPILFVPINTNDIMNLVLNSSNVNRTGVHAVEINAGATSAPTKAPSESPSQGPTVAPNVAPTRAPTNCGLFGWSLFCPFTLCGIIGRWLGWCQRA